MSFDLMSFDLFGQLVGKARRRAVELDWKLIGKRLGAGAAAAAVVAREKPELLTTRAGMITLATTAAFGMIPFGAGAAGILTPIAPGLASLAGAALATVTGPIAQRRQAAQDLADQARAEMREIAREEATALLNKTNMDGIPKDQLGQAAAPDAVAGGNQ